jgi:hypothetical protein
MVQQKKGSPRKRSRHAIEESKDRIQLLLSGLRIAAKELEEQGIRMAYPHFKADRPNVMFLLEPTDGTGKRRYIHVGTDPEKQEEARAAIARHAKREAILRACARIDRERTDLLDELRRLELKFIDLEHVVKASMRGHADPAGAGDRGNPSEGSHQELELAGSR